MDMLIAQCVLVLMKATRVLTLYLGVSLMVVDKSKV